MGAARAQVRRVRDGQLGKGDAVPHLIVTGHGTLAKALLASAEMILDGLPDNVLALDMTADNNLASMRNAACAATAETDTGVLVLADLLGGTPANAAAWAAEQREIVVVCGVNLPMLLEVLVNLPHKTLPELVELAVAQGRDGIRRLEMGRGKHDG